MLDLSIGNSCSCGQTCVGFCMELPWEDELIFFQFRFLTALVDVHRSKSTYGRIFVVFVQNRRGHLEVERSHRFLLVGLLLPQRQNVSSYLSKDYYRIDMTSLDFSTMQWMLGWSIFEVAKRRGKFKPWFPFSSWTDLIIEKKKQPILALTAVIRMSLSGYYLFLFC